MALAPMAEGGVWVRRKRPESHFIIDEKDYGRHMNTPAGFIDVYVVGADNIKRVLSDGWMLIEDPRIELPEDHNAEVKAILNQLTANQFEILRQAGFFSASPTSTSSAPVAEAAPHAGLVDPELVEAAERAKIQAVHETNDAARKAFGKPAANRTAR